MSDETIEQLRADYSECVKEVNSLTLENDQLRAQVAQLREVLTRIRNYPSVHEDSQYQLQDLADAALSLYPTPPVIEREGVMPLSSSDIMECAVSGKPIPAMRALATYAQESNWTQLYEGKSVDGYKPHACEWAFIGPVRPPYELAQNVLTQLGLLEEGR